MNSKPAAQKPGKFKRRIIRIVLILLVLFYFLPLITRLMPAGISKAETKAFFDSHKLPFTDSFITTNNKKLHFVACGNDTLPFLIFIHGSPGSWDAFKDYLVDSMLLQKAYIISVDRSGYGLSEPEALGSLDAQVEFIQPILNLRKNNKSVTVIGHSYGGPVASLFAVKNESIIHKLILISPTISPNIEEKITWKRNLQKLSKWWIFKWMLPKDLKNSTIEMQPLPTEIRKHENEFANFKKAITEIHGTEDDLAPHGNQDYVKSIFKKSEVKTIDFNKSGHLIPFTETKKLLEILNLEID